MSTSHKTVTSTSTPRPAQPRQRASASTRPSRADRTAPSVAASRMPRSTSAEPSTAARSAAVADDLLAASAESLAPATSTGSAPAVAEAMPARTKRKARRAPRKKQRVGPKPYSDMTWEEKRDLEELDARKADAAAIAIAAERGHRRKRRRRGGDRQREQPPPAPRNTTQFIVAQHGTASQPMDILPQPEDYDAAELGDPAMLAWGSADSFSDSDSDSNEDEDDGDDGSEQAGEDERLLDPTGSGGEEGTQCHIAPRATADRDANAGAESFVSLDGRNGARETSLDAAAALALRFNSNSSTVSDLSVAAPRAAHTTKSPPTSARTAPSSDTDFLRAFDACMYDPLANAPSTELLKYIRDRDDEIERLQSRIRRLEQRLADSLMPVSPLLPSARPVPFSIARAISAATSRPPRPADPALGESRPRPSSTRAARSATTATNAITPREVKHGDALGTVDTPQPSLLSFCGDPSTDAVTSDAPALASVSSPS